MKEQFLKYIHQLQDQICDAVEQIDGKAKFQEDLWDRPEGGGGRTRVISNGGVFEKGGVNISAVHGQLPELMQKKLQHRFSLNQKIKRKSLKRRHQPSNPLNACLNGLQASRKKRYGRANSPHLWMREFRSFEDLT